MIRIYNALKKHRRVILFLCDMILWNISYYMSFAINKNIFLLKGEENVFLIGLIIVNVVFSGVFLLFRLYDKLWRYADIEDFFYAAIASLSANLVFMSCMMIIGNEQNRLNLGSRIYITFTLMSTLFVMLFRIIYRLNKILERRNLAGKAKKRLMIIGAGEGTLSVLSELSKTPGNEYIPVCIVDDDKEKLHRRIAGVKVEGTTYEAVAFEPMDIIVNATPIPMSGLIPGFEPKPGQLLIDLPVDTRFKMCLCAKVIDRWCPSDRTEQLKRLEKAIGNESCHP